MQVARPLNPHLTDKDTQLAQSCCEVTAKRLAAQSSSAYALCSLPLTTLNSCSMFS